MDNHTAQLLIEFVALGNHELDPEQAAAIERLLGNQPELDAALRQERELDAFLGPQMRNVPVPTDLPQRIHTRLAAQRGAAVRRRAYQFAGTTVALMIGLGIVWGLRWSTMPRLDAEAIASTYDPQVQDPFGRASAWLGAQGVAFHPDAAFDTTLITAYEMTEFQGQMVPMLLFVNFRENVIARMYIVQSNDFHLDAITTEARQSFCSVEIIADTVRPQRISYVVIYTGNSLQPFLQREVAPLA